MHCPFCAHADTRVIDSRLLGEGDQVRRRRECQSCKARFTTYETAELSLPRVIKSDGRRETFLDDKLRGGIVKALEKRPVPMERVENAINQIKRRIRERGEREIESVRIGELVMDALRGLDQVAYVRFASVYRSFEDVRAFLEEIERLENELPRPTATPVTGVKLGGLAMREPTDGELLTSIINPNHRLYPETEQQNVTSGGESRMADLTGVMTVRHAAADRLTPQCHFFNRGDRTTWFTPAGPDHAQIGALAGMADYAEALSAHHGGAAAHDLMRQAEIARMVPLVDWLRGRNDVRLLGPADPERRAPTISLVHARPGEELATELAAHRIAAGGGCFYSDRCVAAQGVATDHGVLRVSFLHYTSAEEIDRLIAALDAVL